MGTLNGVTNDFLLKVKIKVYSFSFSSLNFYYKWCTLARVSESSICYDYSRVTNLLEFVNL